MMSTARRLSSTLQGGFFSKSRVHVRSEQCPSSHQCCTPRLLCRNNGYLHVSSECEKSGHFYICHPDQVSKSSIKDMRILKSKSHHPPPTSVHQSAPRRNHPIITGRRSSSSCSHSTKPGDWEKCSVPHSRLVELQTKGFLPLAYMVSV